MRKFAAERNVKMKLTEEQSTALRVYRARHNLTLREFADRIGVSASVVSNWEQGKTAPKGLYLRALVEMVPEVGE
jgi:DNA-binding transcriptional regulator YiaG